MKNGIQLGRLGPNTPIGLRRCELDFSTCGETSSSNCAVDKNIKIAVLSDLHIGPYVKSEFVLKAIDMALGENCDFAVITGDLASSFGKSSVSRCCECVSYLSRRIDTALCIGNHDIRCGREKFLPELAKTGAAMLVNSHKLLNIKGKSILLAGLDDVLRGKPDVYAAFDGAPASDITIVLCHNPDGADLPDLARLDRKIDLMISGHTHGSQVRIFNRPVMRGTRNHAYDMGLAAGPVCPVFITSGLGVTRWPIRMGCKPEIATVTLKAKSA